MSIDSFVGSGNSLRFQMMQVICLSTNTLGKNDFAEKSILLDI